MDNRSGAVRSPERGETSAPGEPIEAQVGAKRWAVRRVRASIGLFLVGLVALAVPAHAQRERPRIEDEVEIQVIRRELYAFTPAGGPFRERLEKGETVHWTGAIGRIGLVLTDRRALGAGSGAAGWSEAPRRIQEIRQGQPMLSERIALLLSDQRVLSYDGDAARWVQAIVGPHERIEMHRISSALAVVVTNRRGLGLAAGTGRFSEIPLQIGEKLEALSALADVATLRTSRRVLLFRGNTGTWAVDDLPLY